MKKIFFLMLVGASLASIYSCSSNETEINEPSQIPKNVVIQDCYTDDKETALEKVLSRIDEYSNEHNLHTKTSETTFVSNIDGCPAEITQSTEAESNGITQKITTYCRVETSYADDYIPSPDYLTRHYTRRLVVARQEILSTAVRRYSNDEWSEWTYYTDHYRASSNHAKNIAFFGGSFAHNLRDGGKGTDRFGFDYNGKMTSLQNLISDIFASEHVGNYAQGGQGIYTGTLSQNATTPYFKYNMYEQIKYALEFSKEKGFSYDIFLLFGGINDCTMNVPIGYTSDPAGDHSYMASFKKAIEFIKSNNPEARIYLITSFPIFNQSDYYNSLNEYVDANLKLAKYYGLPVFDIYNHGFFTYENYVQYYMTDNVHPNGEGYGLVSPYIINLINQ